MYSSFYEPRNDEPVTLCNIKRHCVGIFGAYIKHKSIIEYIENYVVETGIHNLCNESLVNDLFSLSVMKKQFSAYDELSTSSWINQGSELVKKLESDMVPHYEQFILTVKGKNIDDIMRNIVEIIGKMDYLRTGTHIYTLTCEWYEELEYILDPIEKLALHLSKYEIYVKDRYS